MCSLVMSLCSRDVITMNGSRLTGLTCSKAPGFWMVEHQLVNNVSANAVCHEINDQGLSLQMMQALQAVGQLLIWRYVCRSTSNSNNSILELDDSIDVDTTLSQALSSPIQIDSDSNEDLSSSLVVTTTHSTVSTQSCNKTCTALLLTTHAGDIVQSPAFLQFGLSTFDFQPQPNLTRPGLSTLLGMIHMIGSNIQLS